MLYEILLLMAVGVPFSYLFARLKKEAAGIFLCVLSLSCAALSITAMNTTESVQWIPSFGVSFNLRLDQISFPLAFSALVLGGLSALFASRYVHRQERYFFPIFQWVIASILGYSLSTNFLQFYLFFEAMVLPVFFLIAQWGYGNAKYIGFKYFVYMHGGALSLLIGILWLYSVTGTFDFDLLGTVVGGFTGPLFFIMLGFWVKMAVFPFHNWLPDAHSDAPTPVSAILSGVLVSCGGYGMLRTLITVYDAAFEWTAYFALFTMFYGSALAIRQRDIKRMLAFSSISQMGYILLGTSFMGEGAVGANLHILAHAFSKGLLFLCAGSVFHYAKSRDLHELSGIFRRMKVTGFGFVVAALSLSGVPGFVGFFSESLIFSGISAEFFVAGFIVSLLTPVYLLWSARDLIGGKQNGEEIDESWFFKVPILVLSFLIIILGLYPNLIMGVIND